MFQSVLYCPHLIPYKEVSAMSSLSCSITEWSPDHPTVSVSAMREADRRTIENGTPSLELMRRAAQGVFEAYEGWNGKAVLILCGGGNNGGDGYALAEILHDHGENVTLYAASEKRSEDSIHYHQNCMAKGVPILTKLDFSGYDVLVDCLLGTGFRGAPREPIAAVIRGINHVREQSGDKFVISVDINSGMNGDTGDSALAVVSDLTVSIGFVKQGLVRPQARSKIGRLVNADIGIRMDSENTESRG